MSREVPGLQVLEEFLYLRHEPCTNRVGAVLAKFCKLLQLRRLFPVELFGDVDADFDELIPLAAGTEVGNPVATELEQLPGLGAWGDLQLHFACEGRNLHRSAEGGDRELQRHFAEEVVPMAFEDFVVFDVDDDVKVAWRAAHHAGFPIPVGPEARAIVHARWDFDLHFGRLLYPAFPVAIMARVLDLYTAAPAFRASLLETDESAGGRDLADAAASPATFMPAPGSSAGAGS